MKGDNMDKKPKFVDEEDRHPVAGDNGPQMGSQLVEHQAATPAMWPMVGYDPAHTGRCPHDTSDNDGQLKWWYKTHAAFSPVIGADGTVYLGCDEMLQACKPDGSELWVALMSEAPCHCSPAVGVDGSVYLGSLTQGLRAVDPRGGGLKWKTSSPYHEDLGTYGHAPVIGWDGTIYAVSAEGYLSALFPDGTGNGSFRRDPRRIAPGRATRPNPTLARIAKALGSAHVRKWLLDFGPLCGSPAIAPDGSIYIGTNDGYLCALLPGGRPDLIVEVGPVSTSPAIARNGTVYLGMEDGQLVALYPDGKKKWTYRTPGAIRSSCAIARDGTVYFGSEDGCLRALAPDGTKLWKYVTKGPVVSSPSVSEEGTIYFGSGDGFLRALDPDGHKKWEFESKGPLVSSPAIAADGTVYVTSTDGYLYALGEHDVRGDLASGLEARSSAGADKGCPSVASSSGGKGATRFETASRTDVGRSRKGKNEDALGVVSPKNARELKRNGILLVVADGVGGEPHGDEASRIAVDALVSSYDQVPTAGRSLAERLRDGFAKANAAVFSASEEPGHRGMCTTLVAAAVFPDRVVFANVGDSRGYIIPSLIGAASQITVDHSEVQDMVHLGLMTQEQAEVASNRNVITRVVGTSHGLKVDVFDIRLRRGDTVMLCSDGLVTAVSDAEIAGVIQNSPLDVAVDRLVELAKGPKGHDNVTVCAVHLVEA